jgi:hypothetical protein
VSPGIWGSSLSSQARSAGSGTLTLAETGLVLAARLRRDPRDLIVRLLAEFNIEAVPFGDGHWKEAVDAYAAQGPPDVFVPPEHASQPDDSQADDSGPPGSEQQPDQPHALIERHGHVLIVTMNRPRARNALGDDGADARGLGRGRCEP